MSTALRYTDKETMSIVQQVLAGQVNKDLVALLKGRGVGLCGLDGHTITCSRKSDVDLGYVGNVEKVDTTLIEHLLNDGFIPVIATVAWMKTALPTTSTPILLQPPLLLPCTPKSSFP